MIVTNKNENMKQYAEATDKRFVKDIIKAADEQSNAWLKFDEEVHEKETAIPQKYKALMSIAVALTTQCPYCIDTHTSRAKKMGVTEEELAETIMIAAALRSGAAMGYGLLSMKLFKEEDK